MNPYQKLLYDTLAGNYTRKQPKVKKVYALFNGKQKIMSGVPYAVLVSERNKMIASGGYRKDLLIIKAI